MAALIRCLAETANSFCVLRCAKKAQTRAVPWECCNRDQYAQPLSPDVQPSALLSFIAVAATPGPGNSDGGSSIMKQVVGGGVPAGHPSSAALRYRDGHQGGLGKPSVLAGVRLWGAAIRARTAPAAHLALPPVARPNPFFLPIAPLPSLPMLCHLAGSRHLHNVQTLLRGDSAMS